MSSYIIYPFKLIRHLSVLLLSLLIASGLHMIADPIMISGTVLSCLLDQLAVASLIYARYFGCDVTILI